MHSHSVMDKGETRVCTSAKQRRVGTMSVLQIKEKRCAQGNIIMMHSPTVKDKVDTSVCTLQSRTELVRLLSFQ